MSDQDPSVRTWQDATEAHMAQATSAQARHLTVELDQLHRDYNIILCELNEARTETDRRLHEVLMAKLAVERENEVLRGDFTRVRGERDEAQAAFEDTHADLIASRANTRADLQKAEQDRDAFRGQRDAAVEKIEQLTARLARQPGLYHLTDKGMAAAQRVHLLTAADDHVHCCGLPLADLPAGDRTTLNPHGVTCPAETTEEQA